jgi:hypothetical protein
MRKRIIHRIPKLYSGGAEVVLLNIVKALPEFDHVVAYTRFYDNWVSSALRSANNVILREVTKESFPALATEISPDLIVYHFYPPFDETDVNSLNVQLITRVVIYNHYFLPVPFIPKIFGYVFVSHNSMSLAGSALPANMCRVIFNPVADIFFDVSRSLHQGTTIGRHSRSWSKKFPSDFLTVHESFEIPNLTVELLGASDEVIHDIQNTSTKHRYLIRAFNSLPVSEFISGLDVYLYSTDPSITESGPMCILEAMASGIPVITEGRGAMCDFIDNSVTGFLCESPVQFKEAAETLSSEKNVAELIGRNGQAWARENCSIEVYRDRLRAFINF